MAEGGEGDEEIQFVRTVSEIWLNNQSSGITCAPGML